MTSVTLIAGIPGRLGGLRCGVRAGATGNKAAMVDVFNFLRGRIGASGVAAEADASRREAKRICKAPHEGVRRANRMPYLPAGRI